MSRLAEVAPSAFLGIDGECTWRPSAAPPYGSAAVRRYPPKWRPAYVQLKRFRATQPQPLALAAEFAIPKSWLAEWLEGRYRGRPRGAEAKVGDVTLQEFEHGLCVFLPGKEPSWRG